MVGFKKDSKGIAFGKGRRVVKKGLILATKDYVSLKVILLDKLKMVYEKDELENGKGNKKKKSGKRIGEGASSSSLND